MRFRGTRAQIGTWTAREPIAAGIHGIREIRGDVFTSSNFIPFDDAVLSLGLPALATQSK